MSDNPFGALQTVTTPQPREAMVDVSATREASEVQAMVILAKKFPRDQREAVDRILVACQRPTLADAALYSYARGGTDITGPSIRLAEAIAQNWGNIQFGVRELEQRDGESTVESYAWDLESNVRQSKVFQVAHKRHTKKGSYRLEDPRDVYEMVANQAARRMRACILGVVPGDVVEAAVSQCEETLKAKADTSPEAIKKMVEAFAAFGVTQDQIQKRIQRNLDSITPAQVISLRKVYNSLRDGMSGKNDWFDTVETEAAPKGTESLKDKLKGKKAQATAPIVEGPREYAVCPESGPKEGQDVSLDDCKELPCYPCPAWQREPGQEG